MQTNAKPLRSEYENRVFTAKQAERHALEAAAAAAAARQEASSSPDMEHRGSDTWHAGRAGDALEDTTAHEHTAPPAPWQGADSQEDGLSGLQGATARERRAAYRRRLEEQH